MELHTKAALILISFMVLLNLVSGGSEPISWTCVCSGNPSNSASLSNCSSSCHCVNDETSGNSGAWNCSCDSQQNNCFTSCNCTSSLGGASDSGKQQHSNKGILITVILCVALITTIVLLATITCYFYRRDKINFRTTVYTFDKYSSWSSRSNLISHRSASFPDSQSKLPTAPTISGLKEFVRRLSGIFRSERGNLPGVIVRFSYDELEQATNKFAEENVIGVGGSSKVYCGQLSDGRLVAVKKLRPLGGDEADYEFLSEIELISRLNHRHVVPLLGYCSANQGRHSERLLVFEYMSNGNLRDCLDMTQKEGKEPMDWVTRVSIALGAARGLEYLHEAAAPRILHRDIKSTNILLDDKFRAKITDLGMAKRLMTDDNASSCSSSPARMLGTFGYFAPEYAIVGKASLKSDVFSFGVVILELITGRQPIRKLPNKLDESLVIWASGRLRDSKLVVSELPDPILKGKFSKEEMQIMAHLARECLQWDPESRPSMTEVVQILSTIDPDKSHKRRHLPASFFMSSPRSRSTRSANGMENPQDFFARRDYVIQTELERWQGLCASPMATASNNGDLNNYSNHNNTKNNNNNENDCDFDPRPATDLSTEFIERLIMISSNSRSWRSPNDEAVDLREPRLETFTQENAFT